ncbi:MAG: TetR/AcrR family transcriptional regulator [Candidatus Sericytochromatia bacterium]
MKEKDPNKIPAIFQATLELVGETGLAGLKMAAIAKKAHIASGTLYLYFASKEELLNALYRHLKSQHSFLSEPAPDLPIKSRLKTMWEASLRHRLDHFNEALFTEQMHFSSYLSQESKEVSNTVMQGLIQLLDRGKRELIVKDVDNALLLALLLGFLKETVALCRAHQLDLSRDLLETSFALCWDAIKA